jgi:hypothetical protein
MDRRHQLQHSLSKVREKFVKINVIWILYNLSISYFLFLSINLTVGLQKILALLESEDANVRIHAVKVVANLAAEGG